MRKRRQNAQTHVFDEPQASSPDFIKRGASLLSKNAAHVEDEQRAGEAAAAGCRLAAPPERSHVVVDMNEVDFFVFAARFYTLAAHAEVQPIAGIVDYEADRPRRRLAGRERIVNVGGRRRRKNVADDCSAKSVFANEA